MSLLDRFLRYARLDTAADEASSAVPSTAKQLALSQMLEAECLELGLSDVSRTAAGTVYATLPASAGSTAPAICWFAHVDTSPEYSSTNIQPIVHRNYAGDDIALPGDATKVIRVAENPALQTLIGGTVITTDGRTLLGSDDKSGIAVIITAVERLQKQTDVLHGPVRVCFTCDEEIGRGCDQVDLNTIDAVCGYTLDGDGVGKIETETFSADLATVTVTGINTHPSMGKGKMVNAIRILAKFLTELPVGTHSPETTEGRDGFLHPYHIEGGVAQASARILLRDFETNELAEYAAMLEMLAEWLRRKSPRAKIDVHVRPQYRNMREGLKREPRAVTLAQDAIRAAGLTPELSIIRGGTDGSRLTEMGLPTPNLSTGQHNPHSPLEWTSVEEMESAVSVLIQLARRWGQERS